jgi:hypothetical protein
MKMRRKLPSPTTRLTRKPEQTPHCQQHPAEPQNHKLHESLRLMRGIGRIRLGEDPKRDAEIKAAWRSGE